MAICRHAIVGAMLLCVVASPKAIAQRADIDIEDTLSKMLEGKRIVGLTQGAGMVELTIDRLQPVPTAQSDIRVVCAGTGPDRAQIMIQDRQLKTDDRRTVDAGYCDRLFVAARKRFDSQGR